MFQYRQVLVRLRQGDSDRDIARAGLMGRPKVAAIRALAAAQGWLAAEAALPEDARIAAAIGAARRARSTISTVEPHRALVERWAARGIGGVAIHAALCREHGYRGSYSAVRRMLAGIRATLPPDLTVPLTFAPAEAAQVAPTSRGAVTVRSKIARQPQNHADSGHRSQARLREGEQPARTQRCSELAAGLPHSMGGEGLLRYTAGLPLLIESAPHAAPRTARFLTDRTAVIAGK